jgi:hypothetical protein
VSVSGNSISAEALFNVVRRALVLVCLAPGVALANDSTFGGAPADLVPLAEQQVRMLAEDVVLTASDEEWQIEARYQFQNLAAKEVTVQVGFPEFRCPRDHDSDCADAAFRDLVTLVDGVPVQHRQGKLSKKHGWADFLGVVWLFDVTFPVGRPLAITHRYRLTTGGDLSGRRYTGYVTRTGRSWAGSIGRATFTAILPPYVRAIYDVEVPGLRATPPRLLLDSGPPRVELRLEGKDWKPEGGVFFSYNASSTMTLEPIHARKLDVSGSLGLFQHDRCPFGDDTVDAQACLNDLYASRGYPFENPVLYRKYYSGDPTFRAVDTFEGKLWVRDPRPLAAFTTAWFDNFDRSGLKQWTELLAQQRAARAAAPGGGAGPAPAGELPLPAASALGGSAAAAAPAPATLSGGGGATPSAVLAERRNRAEPLAVAPLATESAPSTAATPAAATPAAATPAAAERKSAGGCAVRRQGAPSRLSLGALAVAVSWLGWRARRRLRRHGRRLGRPRSELRVAHERDALAVR